MKFLTSCCLLLALTVCSRSAWALPVTVETIADVPLSLLDVEQQAEAQQEQPVGERAARGLGGFGGLGGFAGKFGGFGGLAGLKSGFGGLGGFGGHGFGGGLGSFKGLFNKHFR